MKNLLFFVVVLLVLSCNNTAQEESPEERSIGFSTILPELKWHLGTSEPVTLVKDLDAKWAAKDYETMKQFFVDTTKFYFADGRIANSPDEFINILKEDDDEVSEDTWTFDYAYSVDLNPATGGEHVQAGFSGTSVKDNITTKKKYHESYYIIEGKIIMWNQFTRDIKNE